MELSGLLPLALRGREGLVTSLLNLEKGACEVISAPEAARPYMIAALRQHVERPILVLASERRRAQEICEQLRIWAPSLALYRFPEPDVLPHERIPWEMEVKEGRLETLAALVVPDSNPLIVATPRALAQKTIPQRLFRQGVRPLMVGDQIEREALLSLLVQLGYQPAPLVEEPGTFAGRGGILDVYPPALAHPVRMELLGDRIESLRSFDPATQVSSQRLSSVTITPAREVLYIGRPKPLSLDLASCHPLVAEEIGEDTEALNEGQVFPRLEFYLPLLYSNPGILFDHLPKESLTVVDDPLGMEQALADLEKQSEVMRQELLAHRELPPDMPSPYFPKEIIMERLHKSPRLEFHSGQESLFSASPVYVGRLEEAMVDTVAMKAQGRRVVIVSRQAPRLAELYREWDVYLAPQREIKDEPPQGSLTLVHGGLSRGFELKEGFLLLSDAEVFGWAKPEPRRPPRPRSQARETFFADFKDGEYVVHIEHGIGIFRGLVTLPQDGLEREYLRIEYAEGDVLYVPAYQADRLSRYVGVQERPPRVDRLGTTDWARIKARAQRAVEEIAEELLALYSLREVVEGHAFSPDVAWQRELESSFPYVETEDQLQALGEVKVDMEESRPMDRLVCGDVGYGKTEVALRAAFKAVMDGKQAALLVPTTVLAQQHYRTFQERLRPFPVEVEMLSRFRSQKEQERIVKGLQAGTIDIIIGTHRLLQNDVVFRDLGLLIIDEEQRFGVTHKERLKEMRQEVDVLTLTATPIPRTLYLSLSGARDMSTIETPPEERLPVITQVVPYDEALIRRAVLRELDRGGQIYFVHNRVQGIRQIAQRLKHLVPEATLVVAHGQMREEELSRAMLDFADGKYDVLVSTSIIENGIDIPNVNTLIVNRADRFGLAQLYQLRGRVGRSSARAYAYLLYHDRLTEEGRKRLQAIEEASELGAGFRIAMRDLEIRGAGEILGTRQHGHISAVGFDLYCRLLAQAVRELKEGRKPEQAISPVGVSPRSGPSIDLPLRAHLPSDYVESMPLRLSLYRRMASMTTLEEVEAMERELNDRFGPLSQEAMDLLYMLRLRLLAETAGVESIIKDDDRIIIRWGEGQVPKSMPPQLRAKGRLRWLSYSLLDQSWRKRVEDALRVAAGVA